MNVSPLIVTGLSNAGVYLHWCLRPLRWKPYIPTAAQCPTVCLHQAKSGLFIERNWIVTKHFAENKGQNIDKNKDNKNKCITDSSKHCQRVSESVCVCVCVCECELKRQAGEVSEWQPAADQTNDLWQPQRRCRNGNMDIFMDTQGKRQSQTNRTEWTQCIYLHTSVKMIKWVPAQRSKGRKVASSLNQHSLCVPFMSGSRQHQRLSHKTSSKSSVHMIFFFPKVFQ